MPKNAPYLQYVEHKNPVNLKRIDFVVRQINKYALQRQVTTLNILDLGCGRGNMSFPLASLGHHVTGVDMDPKSISECVGKNTFPNATFIVGDAESLDEMEKFDIVVCSEVLEHTQSPDLVIQTIDRVLKEDGIHILTIPNGYCLCELVFSRLLSKGGSSTRAYKSLRPLYKFLTGVPTSSSFPFCLSSLHLQFFSLNRLRKLVGRYGYTISTISHADLGLPIPGAGRLKRLKSIECKLADFVPHSLVGGWLFVINRDIKID